MLYIAICDDEIPTCAAVEKMVMEYSKKHAIDFQVEAFFSGEALFRFIEEGNHVDILFLDIELTGVSGVEVGKQLRNEWKNTTIKIIYISSKENYALQLFKVRPIDFLIKPLGIEEVDEALDRALEELQVESQFFEYKFGHRHFRIPVKDIYYFQSEGKKIKVVNSTGEPFWFYGKLNDTLEQIPAVEFLNIHKSFLVRFDCIVAYESDSVKLVNDEVLFISQAYRKKVKMQLLERRKGHM